jgi:hypothetical protein
VAGFLGLQIFVPGKEVPFQTEHHPCHSANNGVRTRKGTYIYLCRQDICMMFMGYIIITEKKRKYMMEQRLESVRRMNEVPKGDEKLKATASFRKPSSDDI